MVEKAKAPSSKFQVPKATKARSRESIWLNEIWSLDFGPWIFWFPSLPRHKHHPELHANIGEVGVVVVVAFVGSVVVVNCTH